MNTQKNGQMNVLPIIEMLASNKHTDKPLNKHIRQNEISASNKP